ncbi:class A sortase SrtA [Staphylococcus sp. 11261D007BR]
MEKWLMPIIGIVLIVGGIYLIFKPKVDAFFIHQDNEKKVESYETNANEADTSNESKAPEIPKDKSQVAGVLEVPSVDIKEPVYPGPATPEQLDRGVSFAEEDESLDDQNIAIAGHTDYALNYQFTDMHEAKKGDDVTFTVGKDKRRYKITSIRDVDPYEVEVLDEMNKDKDQLTLITCDDYDEETGTWLTRKIYVAEAV